MSLSSTISSLLFLMTLFSSAQNSSEVKTEVIDSTFIIPDNPQQVYRGFYKDKKPYNGYFKVGEKEFFWVEYYKDGEKTHQYSFNLFKRLIEEEREDEINPDYIESGKAILNIKSTFKNSEIVDGEIISRIKDGYLVKKYSNGKITQVNIDVFAMHYGNRLTFAVNENNIVFSQLRDPVSMLRFSVNNGRLLIELLANDTIVASNNLEDCNPKNPNPNSNIRIFKIKERIDCLVLKNNEELREYEDNLFMLQNILFSSYSLPSDSNDTNDFLQQFLEKLSPEEEINKEEPLPLAYFDTDKNGLIKDGIYWEEVANNSGSYKIYKDGKIVREGKNTLLDFQKTLDKYFNKE